LAGVSREQVVEMKVMHHAVQGRRGQRLKQDHAKLSD
jgi:hypothetical protein